MKYQHVANTMQNDRFYLLLQIQGKWYKNRIPKTILKPDTPKIQTLFCTLFANNDRHNNVHPIPRSRTCCEVFALHFGEANRIGWLTSASILKGARASRCSLPWSWFLMQLLLGSEQKLGMEFYFQLGSILERVIDLWGSFCGLGGAGWNHNALTGLCIPNPWVRSTCGATANRWRFANWLCLNPGQSCNGLNGSSFSKPFGPWSCQCLALTGCWSQWTFSFSWRDRAVDCPSAPQQQWGPQDSRLWGLLLKMFWVYSGYPKLDVVTRL